MICGVAKSSTASVGRQGTTELSPIWSSPEPKDDATDYRDCLLDSLTRRYKRHGPLTPMAIAEAVAEAQGGVRPRQARLFPKPSPAPLRQQSLGNHQTANAPKRVTL